MKQIHLTRGAVALVDDEDFEYLNQWKWLARSNGNILYAARSDGGKFIHMHRVVANTPDGMVADHIDGNGLNNQKSNLRNCTDAQNKANVSARKNNTSGYKGVSKYKKAWVAYVRKDNKKIYLGYFRNILDAARAYNEAAKKYFGEFARLNDI